MIAGLFLYACARARRALPAPRARPPTPTRDRRALRTSMLAAVEEQAWDGDWYLRAFDAAGKPVGSHTCDEGQDLHREPGLVRARRRRPATTAAPRRRSRACTSTSSRPNGVVLQQPAYTRLPPRARRDHELPARATRRTPASSATTTRGSTSAGACSATATAPSSTTSSICPSAQGGADRDVPQRALRLRADDRRPGRRDARRGEELAGSPARPRGRSSRSRRASSASSPTTTGLRIDPCIPPDWTGFHVDAPVPRRRLRDRRSRTRRASAAASASLRSTAARSTATSSRSRRARRPCEVEVVLGA